VRVTVFALASSPFSSSTAFSVEEEQDADKNKTAIYINRFFM
jgi:hypothetical protein